MARPAFQTTGKISEKQILKNKVANLKELCEIYHNYLQTIATYELLPKKAYSQTWQLMRLIEEQQNRALELIELKKEYM